jgi:hypothetical protein
MTRSAHVDIRRTGQTALRLPGYGLSASATSRTQQAPTQTRWHELELWTDDTAPSGPEQRHCLVIRYCTQWQGELGHDHAEMVLRRGIGDALRGYDPIEWLIGYPSGQNYEERQLRLQRALRSGYEHAVSELLAIAEVWEVADQ